MSLPINGETITRVGTNVSVATMGGGWMADVMSWQWGTISFIVGTVMAVLTFAWNAYYKHKEYKLKEKALEKGLEYYEHKQQG
jgi:hypothetical protein